MSQFSFTKALLEACKAEGINTVIETCGYAGTELYEQIIPLVDTFLYDIKETDATLHREFTGVANDLILENLEFLYMNGAKIVLRCPIIPGLNDRTDHFGRLAQLSIKHQGIEGVELMPYHKLGALKHLRLGTSPQVNYEVPSEDTVKKWQKVILDSGGKLVKH